MTTNVKNLFVAGEAVGGIHGKNRLMGNSLLDIIVFGRCAGKNAAKTSTISPVGTDTTLKRSAPANNATINTPASPSEMPLIVILPSP